MKLLPFFVYGTLRVGQGNYLRCLAGTTESESPARASGVVLFGHGIPYAVEREGGAVIGDLIDVAPRHYDDVLNILDSLEGFRPTRPERSHYVRVERTVEVLMGDTWEPRTAWMYLAGESSMHFDDRDLIPDGDWVKSRAA